VQLGPEIAQFVRQLEESGRRVVVSPIPAKSKSQTKRRRT
jgi:hypothetical protein